MSNFKLKYTLIGACMVATATLLTSGACAQTNVDTGVKPGDDFFAYANSGWLRSTEIPAGKERWGARNEIDELTRRQVAALVDDAAAAPAGSPARKVADFRAAYLNESAIEARGLAPIKPLLDRIDRINDKPALVRALGSGLAADVDPLNWGVFNSSHLLGLSVEPGIRGEKTYVAFLLQGGLGLPDREHYVSDAPKMKALRARYQEYIARMLALAGHQGASERAEAVMALETAIAHTHATKEASADEDKNVVNLWSRADFAREAPALDWTAFFAAAGLSKQQSFVVWQPSAVRGAAVLVASRPLDVWQDYMRFRIIDRYAEVLPRAFAEPAFALHGAEVSGQAQQAPRTQRAMEATQQAMGEAIGRMYAERHFPPETKAYVKAIAESVIHAFGRRLETVGWMTPASKAQARAKLKALYFGLGYPEKWQDYSDLTIDPLDAVGNLRRVAGRNYGMALARLGQPVDKTEWWMTPQTVGAVLLFQQNAYNFPAALLQAPKFDPEASMAANYGAIGAIVGHEVCHFVDNLGADYDAQGRKTRWWTAEDMRQYQVAFEPLVQQFSGYRPFPDMAIDGKLTLTENIADLCGLAAAFDAYRLSLGDRDDNTASVRESDRQFFIGFARSWRSKIREDALRKQVATNDHAPEAYRIATVRNLDAWYEAFDVRPGQRLYLEPAARVRVW
jgi:predicted metalloendopeptidase